MREGGCWELAGHWRSAGLVPSMNAKSNVLQRRWQRAAGAGAGADAGAAAGAKDVVNSKGPKGRSQQRPLEPAEPGWQVGNECGFTKTASN